MRDESPVGVLVRGKPLPLYVAGVGASAGGLEAMLSLFATLPRTGRIAFVVAQHMAKNGHDELMVRLIQRESALPVTLTSDGTRMKADTIYVIPSGHNGTVAGDTIKLSAPGAEHLSTPSVNALFDSLASVKRNLAIGIVLSGTGSDGVNGCRAIQSAGGLTIAQDPADAKFDGMPSAAIRSRTIEKILPTTEMGRVLGELFPGSASVPDCAVAPVAHQKTAAAPAASSEIAQLLKQVLDVTGIDFSSYKEETLLRRLEKRKSVLGLDTADAYRRHIRDHPEEIRTLQHLFLVSVSSFFRDPESFVVLKNSLKQRLLQKQPTEPVRVWVPGCASGEEPLTLAILLKELDCQRRVEITATDLNPDALAVATEGTYPENALRSLEASIRTRYFVAKGKNFCADPALMKCIKYERRDVFTGTPEKPLDLVSCRNLLIYMKSQLQDKLIKSFHSALLPAGLLFIGQSESLSVTGEAMFSPIDQYHRLFQRRQ